MHVFGSFGWLWKVAIFIAVGTSLYAVHHNGEAISKIDTFNERIIFVSMDYCNEIEDLKKEIRDEAQDDFDNRYETLALLGLPATSDRLGHFERELAQALADHKKKPCPRPPMPLKE
jgi:hypothetical protein